MNNILSFDKNSVGVRDVMNNACATLDFKLLAIEENISPNKESLCLYDPSKIDFSCCPITDAEYAHLYISTKILNQHCIILFANKTLIKINYISDLVDKFYNSIERLKKQNADLPKINHFKQLRFYIYFYGDAPPITIYDRNRYCDIFARALEQRLGYKKNELDACVIPRIRKCVSLLTIFQKDNLMEINP
jgi:hypothetical protein